MKKTIGLLVLVAVMCSPVLADTISFQNNTGTGYDGCVDAAIRQETSKAYKNFGGSEHGAAGFEDATHEMNMFVRFDDMFGSAAYQLPEGKTITSAKLKMFCESMDSPTQDRTINAYAMYGPTLDMGTGDGVQIAGTVSWRRRADGTTYWYDTSEEGPVKDHDYTTIDAASATFSFTGNGWVEWDVTAIVQAWYAGTLDNEGFLMRQPSYTSINTRTNFTMEDGGGNAPLLEITYTPEPATMCLLAVGGLALLKRKSA